MAHPERELGALEEKFFNAIEIRKAGLPVAYITGEKEFWGRTFRVTQDVLIPKPDTEILVERAITLIQNFQNSPVTIMDVCTGSGCIALSLAADCPTVIVTATDISSKALSVARGNASKLLCGREITFLEADLRGGLPGEIQSWDMIISNPPYVPSKVATGLLEDGRSEPLLALDGGLDGLDLIKPLAQHAFKALKKGGYLLIETGEYNAAGTAAYLKALGFIDILTHRDLAGQDRVIEGRRP